MDIQQLLTQLHDIRCQLDLLAMDKQTAIDSVLSDEQRRQIADIESEFGDKVEAAQANASIIETQIKSAVIEYGSSVKVDGKLNAVLSKGRVKWDTKSLDGYALNVPELYAFRTEGKPTVSIRTAS